MSDSVVVERPELKRVMGPGLLLLFVVGDILGTGVYALTGKVAGEVGGAVWLPFLCAFVVAMLTATSYLELVTKYPKAGGAAVYTHKAFGIHFLTFLLTFAVMCSGLTSASSASKAFAANFFTAVHLDPDRGALLMITALGFMTLIALVNLRGVGESVKANVVLTCVELSGLLIVIGVGAWALLGGDGDTSRLTDFHVPEGESPFGAVTAATALAFFAMVGFEDSVNMAEETKDPVRIFPRMMLIGLSITGVIYVLVAISAVALVAPDELNKGATPLLKVVQAGAPGFPLEVFAWITMFAVANSALINMLMASRLLYGMSHERVLPGPLGRVLHKRRTPYIAILFTTLLAFFLIGYADLAALGGTTAFLLLCVFAVVNVAVLVLRRDKVEHKHFHAPTALPVLGVVLCVYLASPFSGRDSADYKIAGWLMLVGVGLWALTWLLNKYVFKRHADFDPTHLDPQGPVN
ncbi:APC family permease [Kribbella sp. NPDC051137]|uniref:APC family permease n=1 Tax=Kribbella sp. NPDC051137 TaxID=3155045 RepID=UPI00342D157C